jgi:hypothetical protein
VRRLSLAAAALCAALFSASAGVGAAAPCPPLEYPASVQSAAAALGQTPPDIAGAASTLQELIRTYPETEPTLSPVLSQLQATPPQTGDAQTRLETIAGALALPRGSTCNADQRPARSALNGVYQSPVFANLDRKPVGPNPISQFLAWLGSLLHDLTGHLGAAGSIALGAALLAAALLLAAWRLRGILGARPLRLASEREPESGDPDREWSLAERAAARGDYREAVRRAFRSALLSIAIRGRLSVDPSWTTHELLAATRGDAGLLAALAPAAELFDRAWYSGTTVGASDWQRARGRCDGVRRLARSGAAVTHS